jgi:hypothetical protein
LVFNDTLKPRREFRRALILVEVPVSLRECVLHLIFGIPAVAEHESGVLQAAGPVSAGELTESITVTLSSLFNKFFVGKAVICR